MSVESTAQKRAAAVGAQPLIPTTPSLFANKSPTTQSAGGSITSNNPKGFSVLDFTNDWKDFTSVGGMAKLRRVVIANNVRGDGTLHACGFSLV